MRKILIIAVVLLMGTAGICAREVVVPVVPENATTEECDSMERYLGPCVDYVLKHKPVMTDATLRRVSVFNISWLSCTSKITAEVSDKLISPDAASMVVFVAAVTKAYLTNPTCDHVKLHQEAMRLMLKYYKKNKKLMPQEPYQTLLKKKKEKSLDAFVEQTVAHEETNQ